MEPSSNSFDELIRLFSQAACGVMIAATIAFAAAAWRAYRNAQITRQKMICILLFLFVCFLTPILVLLFLLPRGLATGPLRSASAFPLR